MRRELADGRVKFHVGDVRDSAERRRRHERCRHVFHAAALKQVPSCEFFPHAGRADQRQRQRQRDPRSRACGVESVVCLSTDKAVYPINAMGISKAMMEKVAQAHARNRRDAGTIVSDHPLRQRHVQPRVGHPGLHRPGPQGKPLTVTDPR